MRRLRAFVLRLRGFFARTAFERDLSTELQSHLELQIEDNIRAGMTAAEARRDGLARLGGVEITKEAYRERWTVPRLEHLFQDVRYAGRLMRTHPGFTIVAVLTLACGIGGITAIFTALNAVLLKPLPVRAPHELFVVYETAPEEVAEAGGSPGRLIRFSYPRFERLEQAVGGDGTLAAMSRPTRVTLRTSAVAVTGTAQGQLVSGRFFEAFAVTAALGRVLGNNDTAASDPSPVAVISHRLWQTRFGGAADVVGHEVLVNEVPITIVGVTPPAFNGVWLETPIDLWLPLPMQHAVRYRGNASFHNSDGEQPWMTQPGIEWLNIAGRITSGRLDALQPRLDAANRLGLLELAEIVGDRDRQQRLLAHSIGTESFARGFSGIRDRSGQTLVVLVALAGLVLLVVCSNVANLLLVRAAGRQREIAVRMSLGATRGRLIRQCLVEGLLLAGIGGVFGFLAANWISAVLGSAVLDMSRDVLTATLAPDVRVVGFVTLLSLSTTVMFGLVPALWVSRIDVQGALVARISSASHRNITGMHVLVGAQLAMSFVVVAMAGLFGRSLLNLTRLDPGFDREHVVTIAMDPVASGYTLAQAQQLYTRLLDALATIPGVSSATVSTCALVSGCEDSSGHQFEGYEPRPGETIRARDNFVGPGYFATVGMPLVSGRDIEDRDTASSPRVAVVNESLARRYFGNENPVGRRLGFSLLDTEIVGVVRDARVTRLRQAPVPMVYRPITQFTRVARALDVRVAGDPGRSATEIRETIGRREPRLLLTRVAPLGQFIDNGLARDRAVAYLIAAFGALALFLTCIGLYGVLSFAIVHRTRELGVRLALGATSSEVIRMVVSTSLRIAMVAVPVGAAVAVAAGRVFEAQLFGTSSIDPIALAAAVASLVATTLAASYLPARRASELDPAAVLRHE
jgi:putative ABC transport system permease protein